MRTVNITTLNRIYILNCNDLPNWTYDRICTRNTKGTTCGAGSAYPSGALVINTVFVRGPCCLVFNVLCWGLFATVCLGFFSF